MGMIGAILGDIAGQAFEFQMEIEDWQKQPYDLWNHPSVKGNHYTDDTVMTIACGMAIADGTYDFKKWYKKLGNDHWDRGYGRNFYEWLMAEDGDDPPYQSYGNGSAMRASACGQFASSLRQAERLGRMSAMCTHNHPEGIRGAETEAGLTWLAMKKKSKDVMLSYMLKKYPPERAKVSVLTPTSKYKDAIRFDVSCQGSMPVAFRCFFETDSFETMMWRINSMQVDTDTIGAIAGSWAEEYYGNCTGSKEQDMALVKKYLPEDLIRNLEQILKDGIAGAKRSAYLFWE